MNERLEKFARSQILEGLMGLSPGWHTAFRREVAFKRMFDTAFLLLTIEECAAKIPTDELDWAMNWMDWVQKEIKKIERQRRKKT
jgi:hypothetical protein